MFHILPKLKAQRTLINRILINFDLVYWKIYTSKYNGNIEGGLSSKRENKVSRGFHGIFSKETKVTWLFDHSVIKPHNSCTTQLVISVVFETSCCRGRSEQTSKKEFYDLLVWPSILCLI